jgi:hypothetical protein
MEAEEIPQSQPSRTESPSMEQKLSPMPEPKASSDDLTSLTWLQNINILTVPGPPTPPASPKPVAKNNKNRIPVLNEPEKHEYR